MGQEPLTYTPQAPQALQLHVRPWLPEPEGRRFRVNSSESLGLGARIRATRSLALGSLTLPFFPSTSLQGFGRARNPPPGTSSIPESRVLVQSPMTDRRSAQPTDAP